jgi:hypothetical protein
MNNFKEIYNISFERIIIVFLILYIALLKPDLSLNIKAIFNNTIFKMVTLFSIVYISNTKPYIALLLTFSFVLTLNYIHVMDSKEAFKTIENFVNAMPIPFVNIGQSCQGNVSCNPGICDPSTKKCIVSPRRR